MPIIATANRRVPSDILALNFHPTYNFVSAVIRNEAEAATTILDPVGYPVVSDGAGGYEFAVAGGEANVIGVIVQGPPARDIPANSNTTDKYAILVRGPAAIRPSGLPDDDYAAAAFDKGAISAALAALDPPILTVDETVEAVTLAG